MTRLSGSLILSLNALIWAVPGHAQTAAPVDVTTMTCADFMAMDETTRNTVATAIDATLAPPVVGNVMDPNSAEAALGITPENLVSPPPPLEGETLRVMQESCALHGDGTVAEALVPQN